VTIRHNARVIDLASRLDPKIAGVPALTAAATRANRSRATYMRRLLQPWQARALSYYDLVGECWNATQFYSRSLKQVRLYAAVRDEAGELEATDDPEVTQEVARIQDPGGGGYSRLMDSYGRLRFLIGEGYYLVTNPDGEDERWEFVSPDELRITGSGTYTRFMAPSLPAEELVDIPDSAFQPVGDQALIFRSWRPHPRFSLLADSPIRAVLDILEELVLLTLAVRGTAKSRLVRNGILLLPEELSPAALTASDGGDEAPANDIFIEDLIEQLLAGITNPGSAASVAPALIRAAGDQLDKIKWLQISNPMETYPEEGLRTEAIRRFATGIEMPAEILLGTADVNHWGAWLINEEAARQYIFPVCQDLCDELTAVFLRPVLKAANVPNWEQYVIAYDATAVVAHPDRSADAIAAHDRLVISDQALRNATDFNDSDAPPQDELERRIATKIMDPSALTDPYEPATTDPVNADDQQTGEEGGPRADTVKEGPPATGVPTAGGAPELSALQRDVLRICLQGIQRGRHIAGSRLRSLTVDAADEVFATSLRPKAALADVPNEKLAAALGVEWVRLNCAKSDADLVSGIGRETQRKLKTIGVNGDRGERIGELVQHEARRGLYRDQIVPSKGFAQKISREIAE
jgi:hypothetical protein